jgi:colicin import membrane protein
MSVPNLNERKETADKARQAMLEKFRAKVQESAKPDPTIVAMREELAKERETKRAAAEEKRKARIAAEKAQRIAEAKAKAEAEAERMKLELIAAAQRRRAEREAAEIKSFEDQAKRDLANATLRARRK